MVNRSEGRFQTKHGPTQHTGVVLLAKLQVIIYLLSLDDIQFRKLAAI